ncbi:DUF4238 domain-containing protein [Pseudomonas shahriarae]|uniref:DUF4238 domain-containing protein n=1 Tax=Pseudomonas shahriarae TaxID=2745512 RepID=UPI002360740D|nr:DUF4238 domain-containing protein [Pseudomonas shahriarae]MDD1132041.1 DUF4238 domain-containing protein [Pseudomonas shahriarae]
MQSPDDVWAALLEMVPGRFFGHEVALQISGKIQDWFNFNASAAKQKINSALNSLISVEEAKMSGSRHHFIPRFLQKGFASRSTSKDVYCWTFTKGLQPFQPNIQNVGIETLFYSMSAETELDDKISKEEQDSFSPLVDKLRVGLISEEETTSIAEMLAHFEVRNQHLRSNANILFSELMDTLVNTFTNVEFLQELLPKIMSPNSATFQKSLMKAGISRKTFKQIIKTNPEGLRECQKNIARSVSNAIYEQRHTMPAMIAGAIKSGHIQMLNESIAPKKRVSRYSILGYSVQNYLDANLPLGDSIVLFHVAGQRKFKPFLDKSDELIAVILPLSSGQYLLGTNCEVNVEHYSDLALEIARCSFEYFISNESSERTKKLQSEIGVNSHWLPSKAVYKIFADSLDKILEDY